MHIGSNKTAATDKKDLVQNKVVQRLKQELSFVSAYKNQDTQLSQIEREIEK